MRLVETAGNPAPEGAVVGQMAALGGVNVRICLWPQTGLIARGTVCLFSGAGEFIEKYFETVRDLRKRGFAVATMDWRGQGGSDRLLPDPNKGHVEDFADYESDLRKFMAEIVLPKCPGPYYAMAHSMGGHILLRSALTEAGAFKRLIVSAPMVDISRNLTQAPFLRLLIELLVLVGFEDAYVPGGGGHPRGLDPFGPTSLSSDPVRYQRIREVLKTLPGLGLGAQTMGWLRAASHSIVQINTPSLFTSLKVPTFIVAAGSDIIASTPVAERFAARFGNCQIRVVAGARHELLLERDELRDQFWAAFDAHIGA
ncbi:MULTISPECIES: alpha/beta hydrolase [Rhodomicrobium]|uniref:alpha/beta fold hydrolase n=1 Tax=Rhodomicrobium TaxID=1068 RepID=UPI000B4C0E47|nr:MULTISPECIES: alpha/beta hydrolase [Rhodomicrobium]